MAKLKEGLQEEINKLPVIHKAHVYEPRIEDVAEVSSKAGYEAGFDAGRRDGQQRVERIFGEIEEHFAGTWRQGDYEYVRLVMTPEEWDTIKKEAKE